MLQKSNCSLTGRKLLALVAIVLVLGSGFSPITSWSAVQSDNSVQQNNFWGVVYPKGAKPGDEITVSVTTDPSKFENVADLEVVTFPAPDSATPKAGTPTGEGPTVASLDGMSVDLGDGPQPANKPITKKIPWGAAFTAISVFLNDFPQHKIGGGTVPVQTAGAYPPNETTATTHTPAPPEYNMPPITTPGSVTVIQGPSTGNGNEMTATLNGEPLKIVAAYPGKSFIDVPQSLPPAVDNSGQDRWQYVGGKHMPPVELNTGRASLGMYAGHTMITGQSEEMTVAATVSGVADWRYSQPLAALVRPEALREIKGLKENGSSDGGAVVIIVKNRTKDIIDMNDFVWVVRRQDLVNGVATKKVKVRARQRGHWLIQALLIPYLPQTTGQALLGGERPGTPLASNQTGGVSVGVQSQAKVAMAAEIQHGRAL